MKKLFILMFVFVSFSLSAQIGSGAATSFTYGIKLPNATKSDTLSAQTRIPILKDNDNNLMNIYVPLEDLGAYVSGILWGNISGTLSDQTDLQTALDLKANDSEVVHLAGAETITGDKSYSRTNAQIDAVAGDLSILNKKYFYDSAQFSVKFPYNSQDNLASTIIGYKAGEFSDSDFAVFLGYTAGQRLSGTGHNSVAVGKWSLQSANGAFLTALGDDSGKYQRGSNNSYIGEDSGFVSLGSNNVGVGTDALKNNEGSNNIHIAANDENFYTDSANSKNYTPSDISGNFITLPSHGLGADDTYINMKILSATVPGKLTVGQVFMFKIVDSNTIEKVDDLITGSDSLFGTENGTFAPQFRYDNTISIGNGSISRITASNQIVLGNTNITDLLTSANITANSFIKTGGTSSQFLKADGSIDSNSYLLSSSYTAADVLSKLLTVDGSGSGLDADLLRGVHWGNVNTNISTTGNLITRSTIIRDNAGGVSVISQNAGTDPTDGLIFRPVSDVSSTGQFSLNFNSTAVYSGALTANSFIKSGGTNQQALLADGTTKTVPKVYTALISQSGTDAPTATILDNNLGGTVTWARSSPGIYTATLSISGYTADKTIVFTNEGGYSSADSTTINWVRTSSTIITFRTVRGGSALDGLLNVASVKIEVYP